MMRPMILQSISVLIYAIPMEVTFLVRSTLTITPAYALFRMQLSGEILNHC